MKVSGGLAVGRQVVCECVCVRVWARAWMWACGMGSWGALDHKNLGERETVLLSDKSTAQARGACDHHDQPAPWDLRRLRMGRGMERQSMGGRTRRGHGHGQSAHG